MELLSKKVVKEKQDSQVIELSRTIGILKEEECRIVKRVNGLKETERKEREKVRVSLVEIQKESNKVKEEIKSEITNLELEVVGLEERRQSALKPIYEIETEANLKLKRAEEKEAESERRSLTINRTEDELAEKVEYLAGAEKDNLEKTREANERMEAVIERERIQKGKEEELDKEVITHYRLLEESNKALKRKETEIKAKEMIVEELNKRAIKQFSEIDAERRVLQSNYQALEEAKKHLNIND